MRSLVGIACVLAAVSNARADLHLDLPVRPTIEGTACQINIDEMWRTRRADTVRVVILTQCMGQIMEESGRITGGGGHVRIQGLRYDYVKRRPICHSDFILARVLFDVWQGHEVGCDGRRNVPVTMGSDGAGEGV